MIKGIGTDIVKAVRMKAFIKRETLFKKVFFESERDYCLSKKNPLPYLAGHFAVKESVVKVLQEGNVGLVGSIEICHESTGAPYVVLHGKAKELMEKKGIKTLWVSISHEKDYSVGMAIGED